MEANGESLRMCIERIITDQNPLLTLMNNPYAHDIFDEADFQLEVFEMNEEKRYLIIRKRINGTIGYAFIVERDFLSVEEMRTVYSQYKKVVVRLSNGNFRDVELIIIYRKVDEEVFEIVKEYNQKYSHRPPIRLILNAKDLMNF